MDVFIGTIIIIVFLWLSLVVLKFLFVIIKNLLGWIGAYILSSIPAVMMYFFTLNVFDYGTSKATLVGLGTAMILGTVMNVA